MSLFGYLDSPSPSLPSEDKNFAQYCLLGNKADFSNIILSVSFRFEIH